MIEVTEDSFHESIQYNAALAKRGAIISFSSEKVYQELGLKSLRKRCWYRKLCYSFKIFKDQFLDYLFRLFSSVSKVYNIFRNSIF